MKSFTDFVVGERYKCLAKEFVCLFSSQDGVLMKSDDGLTAAVAIPDKWSEVPPPPPPKKMKTFYRPIFQWQNGSEKYSCPHLFDTRPDAISHAEYILGRLIDIKEVQVEVFDA
jgi:hypothetical protein